MGPRFLGHSEIPLSKTVDFSIEASEHERWIYLPHQCTERTCKRARYTNNIVHVHWQSADMMHTAWHATTGPSGASQIARASDARHARKLRPIARGSSRAFRRYARRLQRWPNRNARRPAMATQHGQRQASTQQDRQQEGSSQWLMLACACK